MASASTSTPPPFHPQEETPNESLDHPRPLIPSSPPSSTDHHQQQQHPPSPSRRKLVTNPLPTSIKSLASAWETTYEPSPEQGDHALLADKSDISLRALRDAFLLASGFWIVPAWTRTLAVLSYAVVRAEKVDRILRELDYGCGARLVGLGVVGVWFAICWVCSARAQVPGLDFLIVEKLWERLVGLVGMSWVNYLLAEEGTGREEGVRVEVDSACGISFAVGVGLVVGVGRLGAWIWGEFGFGSAVEDVGWGDLFGRFYVEICMGVAMVVGVVRWVMNPSLEPLEFLWMVSDEDAEWKVLVRGIWEEQTGKLCFWVILRVIRLYECWSILSAWLCVYLPEAVRWSIMDFHSRRLTDRGSDYRYRPLAPKQFRVLILHRSWPGMIKAELAIVHPTDVEYEMLSYRCRDPAITTNILIDGARITIPRSAARALLTRCSMWYSRVVWIDAVCIDHSNPAERAPHLVQTQLICRMAVKLIAIPDVSWLSRLAVDLLYRHYERPVIESPLDDETALSNNLLTYKLASCPKFLLELRELMCGSYWSRSWTMQELVCVRRVDVYFGGLFVPFEVLARGHEVLNEFVQVNLLAKNTGQVLQTLSTGAQLNRLHLARTWYKENIMETAASSHRKDSTFLTCLQLMTEYRSRHFLTQIQAPMATTHGSFGISLSDSLPIGSVFGPTRTFRGAALHYYLHPRSPSLDLLPFAGTGHGDDHHPRLEASWIPDLRRSSRRPFSTDPLDESSRWAVFKKFRASRTTSPCVFLHPFISGALTFRGQIIDSVAHLSACPRFPSLRNLPSDPRSFSVLREEMFEWIRSAIALAETHCNVPPDMDSMANILNAEAVQPEPFRSDNSPGMMLEAWLRAYSVDVDVLGQAVRPDPERVRELSKAKAAQLEGPTQRFCVTLLETCGGRKFAITEKGRAAIVPPGTERGDRVVVIWGCGVPMVLRRVLRDDMTEEGPRKEDHGSDDGDKVGETPLWRIVGEAYVNGVMQGEGLGLGEHRVEELIVV